MNADQPSPAAPTSVPTALSPAGPSLPVIPHPDHPPKDDQSPVLLWLQSTWDKLKAGQVGDPKWIALVVGLILVAGGWWFFARSSKKADSALWYQFDTSLSKEDLKTFTDLPANASTDAARIGRLNDNRLKLRDALTGLTAERKADRAAAAKGLEEARDEFAKLAEEFKRDKTLRSQCWLLAADAEMALVGVPKEGSTEPVQLDPKKNGRGQVDKVADLTKKAAEAIGAGTDAGQKLTADADRYLKDEAQIYKIGGFLHAAFNEADATPIGDGAPIPPLGGSPITPPPAGTDGPKAPDKPIPDPVNPIKSPEVKPEDKPKEPAPLAPAAPPADKK